MTWLRLRHVAEINPSTPEFDAAPDDAEVTFVPLEAVWPRALDVSRTRTKAEVAQGYTRFCEGDVLVPKITPTFEAGRSTIALGLRNGFGTGTTELHVVRPGPSAESRYVNYLVSSRGFLLGGAAEMIGVAGQKRVPDAWLRNFYVPIQSPSAQAAIADFLDIETARIDALITRKRCLVALLAEREAGRLRGVMEGLLRIWPAIPAKRLVSESDERLGQHPPPPLLSVSIHRGVVPRDELTDKLPRAEELASYKVCQPGDIAINRMRAFQGGVGVVTASGIVSPDYTVLRLSSRVRSDFLHFTFRSSWFVGEMTRRVRGIGGVGQGNVRTPRVNFSDLGLIRIPIPPIDEQRAIAQRLQADSDAEHRVLERLGRQLCLLEERRQALITAAVAGELQVPGVAA